MSFPGIFRRLFEKDGAGPRLRKEILPPHADMHTANGGDPLDLAALGGASAEALAALQQQVAKLAETVAGEPMKEWRTSWIGVPRPWRSTTLPPNHCWANGDFVAFTDWPEIEQVYAAGGFAGMLMPWDANSGTQAASLGRWRPDAASPTGLYTPALTGIFLRAWTSSSSLTAGAFQPDAVQTGVTGSLSSCFTNPISQGLFGVAYVSGNCEYTYQGESSKVAVDKETSTIYTATSKQRVSDETRPKNASVPYVIYLGYPKS